MSELVEFLTDDGLKLTGLLSSRAHPVTVIHIHGKCGNFYDNQFLKKMFTSYPAAGINLLAFNNRGAGVYSEFSKNGETKYFGTSVETIEECLIDLHASIEFCSTFCDKIILQGHSWGCEKVFYFSLNYPRGKHDLILLSPSDGYRLQDVYIAPETVEEQYERLLEDYDCESNVWVSPNEYGIRNVDVDYHVPITARALRSLIAGPAFELFRLDRPWTRKPLSNRAYCFLGGEDHLQIDPVSKMADAIRDRFTDIRMSICDNGGHHLGPSVETNIANIAGWINAKASGS